MASGTFERWGMSEDTVAAVAGLLFALAAGVVEFVMWLQDRKCKGEIPPPPAYGTMLALVLALGVTGCAHMDAWGEARELVGGVDADKIIECADMEPREAAKCAGVRAGGEVFKAVLRRAGTLLRDLILSRSGAGSEDYAMSDEDVRAAVRELELLLPVLEAEGMVVRP